MLDSSLYTGYCRFIILGSGAMTTYEAEALGNTLGETAEVLSHFNVSGGQDVSTIGNRAANYLQVKHINVPTQKGKEVQDEKYPEDTQKKTDQATEQTSDYRGVKQTV